MQQGGPITWIIFKFIKSNNFLSLISSSLGVISCSEQDENEEVEGRKMVFRSTILLPTHCTVSSSYIFIPSSSVLPSQWKLILFHWLSVLTDFFVWKFLNDFFLLPAGVQFIHKWISIYLLSFDYRFFWRGLDRKFC